MRRSGLPFLRLGLAVLLAAAPLAAAPAKAQMQRTVSDWLALANRQLAEGKTATALVLFGEIAARHPRYAPAQDGLRRTFARIGSVRRSQAFLRYALMEEPARARALLAAWQALDRAHPLRFSFAASILPSSNVDHVASERYLVTDLGTFLITDGGKETAGVGLGYRLNLDWILHPRPGARFRIRAGYAGAWFGTARLRFGEPSLALRYEHLAGGGAWSLEAFLSRRRYGGTPQDVTADNIARGLTFLKVWRTAGDGRLLLRLEGDYRSYSKKPYFTGAHYAIDLQRGLRMGARGRLSYGLHLERGLPRAAYHRYTGAELRIAYARPVSGALRLGVSLGVGQRGYDAPFPIVGARRRDRTLSLGLSAQARKLRILGQLPKITCSAVRTRSNIALYTTRSLDCAFTLKLEI